MKANDILDIHITKMISEKPDEYHTLAEIKSQPEYPVFINAMNEFAEDACKEQRKICSNKCVGIWTESELVDRVLESETPDFK